MNKRVSQGMKMIGFGALMSLTLGLAPFTPEPHLFGKIRWIAGGAVGMQPMDWFDAAMHGAPFVYLVGAIVYTLIARFKSQKSN